MSLLVKKLDLAFKMMGDEVTKSYLCHSINWQNEGFISGFMIASRLLVAFIITKTNPLSTKSATSSSSHFNSLVKQKNLSSPDYPILYRVRLYCLVYYGISSPICGVASQAQVYPRSAKLYRYAGDYAILHHSSDDDTKQRSSKISKRPSCRPSISNYAHLTYTETGASQEIDSNRFIHWLSRLLLNHYHTVRGCNP